MTGYVELGTDYHNVFLTKDNKSLIVLEAINEQIIENMKLNRIKKILSMRNNMIGPTPRACVLMASIFLSHTCLKLWHFNYSTSVPHQRNLI
jgi:hypothetical protein